MRGWLILSLLVSGCTSASVSRSTVVAQRFVWPEGVTLVPSGTYHGVNIILELDPEEDMSTKKMTAGEAGLRRVEALEPYANVMIPQLDGHKEIYRYGTVHQVEFYHGLFHVGTARYPPKRRGSLFVFKSRQGDFRFTFRGQDIAVAGKNTAAAGRGSWIPSVCYSTEIVELEDEDEAPARSRRRRAHLTREIVEIGRHRLETDPESSRWWVDGRPYTPGSDDTLRIR